MRMLRRRGGRRRGAIATWTDSAGDTANASTYTFTSRNIGPAAADRVVLVFFAGGRTSGDYSITGFTIGGVAATPRYASTQNDGTKVFLYSLLVPGGTSATVVVTTSTALARASISIYAAVGLLSETPTDTAEALGNPTLDCDVLAGGFIIAGYCERNSGTISWSGLTKDTQVTAEVEFSTASTNFNAPHTPQAISASYSGSSNLPKSIACAFR